MSKMIISDTEKNCFIKAGIERKKMVKKCYFNNQITKKKVKNYLEVTLQAFIKKL